MVKQLRLASRAALLFFVLMALAVQGCGGKETAPVKEAIFLKLVLTANDDINPNPLGRPSPLPMRIFELAGGARPADLDYMELQANPKAVLEDALLHMSDKFFIQPGQTVTVECEAHPEARVLALTAGYRDIERADWLIWRELPEPEELGWFSSPVNVEIEVRLHELRMEALPAAEQPPVNQASSER